MSFMQPAGVERETVSRQWMTADSLADENGLNAAENCFTLASHEMFASLRKRIKNGKGRRLNRQLYLSRIVHAKYRQQTWTLLLKWFPCANNHNLKYKNEVVTYFFSGRWPCRNLQRLRDNSSEALFFSRFFVI